MTTDASAAQEAFEHANQAAYAANLAYGLDPTPANLTAARELNRKATAAAYAAHDAREHAGGPCDCYARRGGRKGRTS